MLSRMNLSITLKSEPGKYRAYCTGFVDGCKWRIYVSSTIGDHTTVQVKKNPFPHVCHSTRRSGNVKGATKFWICEKIKGWLAEDPNVGPIELQRRPKEHYKVSITYKRVYDGRQLAMEELYGNWKQIFDNMYKFKAQKERSCPGSFVVIDHHTIEGKIRFKRLIWLLIVHS
ncbi:uncharacterized protein C2845_PM03G28890 [Panicum miliaceum]|uniref:Transposase MuDR plant domain-containing protein n=1 Tax=Panicum miliaceum TaxID=4540 RepID=A0A3L6TDC9_PANMI|nr:uncharacterized protein C2845_PM03G28890 [Panicum miliaceum]